MVGVKSFAKGSWKKIFRGWIPTVGIGLCRRWEYIIPINAIFNSIKLPFGSFSGRVAMSRTSGWVWRRLQQHLCWLIVSLCWGKMLIICVDVRMTRIGQFGYLVVQMCSLRSKISQVMLVNMICSRRMEARPVLSWWWSGPAMVLPVVRAHNL